jgi:hypothetical protein
MSWECFCFDFAAVLHVAPLHLQWTLAQLFPAIWAATEVGSLHKYSCLAPALGIAKFIIVKHMLCCLSQT